MNLYMEYYVMLRGPIEPHRKRHKSHYALAPWGMQPNTSPAAHFPRFPWAAFHSCLYTAYYTTFPFYTFYMFYTAEIGYWQGEGLTTEDGGQRIAARPARPTVFVYFVVQFFASFAFFALNTIANTIGSDLVVKVTLSVFLAHAW